LGVVAKRRKLLLIARRLFVLASAFAFAAAVIIFVPGIIVGHDLGSEAVTANDRLTAINSMRTTILQAFGGMIVFFGAYVTWRRLAISEAQLLAAQDTQVTGRYAKAVEQLGDPSLDVRLGGIYALERIARNSAVDMGAIIEILGAFVRGRSPWPPQLPGQYTAQAPIEDVPTLAIRAPDVQAAITVLGRMVRPDQPSLRLSTADLRKTRMYGLNFQSALLGGSNLRMARLYDANLIGADLGGADLSDSHLMRSDLSKANLRRANLAGAQLDGARLIGAMADLHTCWPSNFDASAAGVVFKAED
jgi:hypothetical protein